MTSPRSCSRREDPTEAKLCGTGSTTAASSSSLLTTATTPVSPGLTRERERSCSMLSWAMGSSEANAA
eukprot:6931741-Alexandrium_andersonii.AAC.1